MSIIKEKNNTYTVRFSKKDIISNKTIRTKKRGFKTLKDAKEYERGMNRNTTDVFFYSLYQEYQQTKDISKNTLYERDKLIDKYLKDLKTKKYSDITKPYLMQLRNELSRLPISNRTKNKIIALIKSTCQFASNVYDLPNNSKILTNFKVDKKEFQVWPINDYYKFEDAIKEKYSKYIPFFHTLFFTGMRKGEARALTIDDLNIKDKTLTINKSMSKYRKSLKTPKTDTSVRTIKLDNKTFDILKNEYDKSEKWLFGNATPMSLNQIYKVFEYGTKKAKLPKIRIHDLRHSHATYLINNGANIVAVSKRLGHSSIEITLSTYTHLLKDTENQLIDILNVAK